MTKFCGAPRKGNYATCERPGVDRYNGRCSTHREPTPEEREAKHAARRADFAAREHRLDLEEAKSRFLRAALEHGLAAPDTIQAFDRFKQLAGKE